MTNSLDFPESGTKSFSPFELLVLEEPAESIDGQKVSNFVVSEVIPQNRLNRDILSFFDPATVKSLKTFNGYSSCVPNA